MAAGVVIRSEIDGTGSMILMGAGKEGFLTAVACMSIQETLLKRFEDNQSEKKLSWLSALEKNDPHTKPEELRDNQKLQALKQFANMLEQGLRDTLGYPAYASTEVNYNFWDDALSFLGASVQVAKRNSQYDSSLIWTIVGDGPVDFGRFCILEDKIWIVTENPFVPKSTMQCCEYPSINQRVLMSVYGPTYLDETTKCPCYGCKQPIDVNQFIELETAEPTPSPAIQPQLQAPSNLPSGCLICKKPLSDNPEFRVCELNCYCPTHGVYLNYSSGQGCCYRCKGALNPNIRVKVLKALAECACKRRFKYEEEGLICATKGHILCALCSRFDPNTNKFYCRVCNGECLIAQITFEGQQFQSFMWYCVNCEAQKQDEFGQLECLHRVHRSCMGPCKICAQIKNVGQASSKK